MILQSIAWPERDGDRELFYRSDGRVDFDAQGFAVADAPVGFDTYFNAFSYGKWKKYTRLGGLALRLTLKGAAQITLLRHDLEGEIEARPSSLPQPDFRAVTREVACEAFSCEDFKTVEMDFVDCDGADAVSFAVRPLGNAVIHGAAYVSAADTPEPDAVNLALAICTYRREDYVDANMDVLRRAVFDDPTSVLHGHLRVYIADNGQTLGADRYAGLPVRIYPNINSGGSGGFSRAAIEAVNDADYAVTHVILMDDDISFLPCSLERNYSFLALLRPEYAQSLMGGTMLNTSRRYLLYAAGETFDLGGIQNAKEEWDLRDLRYVLLGETDIPVNYFAWWYCCVPASVFRARGFALPFFVQFDDVEFNLRCNDLPKICLNGLSCWHTPLEYKDSDSRYYYNFRNISVMACVHYPNNYDSFFLKRSMTEDCMKAIFTYGYRRAHLILRGAEDFLRGVDWLVAQDPVALNRELIDASDRIVPAEELPVTFDAKRVLMNDDIDQNQLKRRLRWVSLNGWLLPAKRKLVVVEKFRCPMQYFFRAGKVLKYDTHTGLATLSRRSYREALGALRHLRRTRKAIDRDFDRVAEEYRRRHDEICSEAFWRGFLKF